VMCWPHTGQANLNSLIELTLNDPTPSGDRQSLFWSPSSRFGHPITPVHPVDAVIPSMSPGFQA
jgi:hypothetical protein